MAVSKDRVIREIRDYLLLVAFGFAMTAAQVTCRDCWDDPEKFLLASGFTSVLWIVLWKGNEYLTGYISRYISWLKFPVKRFAVGAVAAIVYTIGAMYLITMIFSWSFNVKVSWGVWLSVLITITISLFMHARAFLANWQKASIELEKVRQESIVAKYETLKNQLNPHFLFNSLNALTNLVYEDETKAVKFIDRLAMVYQYVLEARDKELVPLRDELHFLDSYLYLQRIRFEEKLHIEFSDDGADTYVAPLALQMLIENAIKHNIVSQDDPLYVSVRLEKGYIVVANNLQKKASFGESSSGIGLENIRRRYELLSPTPVVITESNERFIVKLPLVHQP